MSGTERRPFGASERAALMRAFGERVGRHRLAAGLSEEELAARCGVSASSIKKTELGRKEPRLSLILMLCTRLGLSPDALMRGLLVRKGARR